jgi:hypothetical protein
MLGRTEVSGHPVDEIGVGDEASEFILRVSPHGVGRSEHFLGNRRSAIDRRQEVLDVVVQVVVAATLMERFGLGREQSASAA